MNIKGIVKIAAAFAGVAAAIFVTDKVVDHVIDKKKEKVSEDDNISFFDDEELDTEETSEVSNNDKAVIKAVVKASIAAFAGLAVFEYGLERGVTSGAAFFTKTPTTYEEAKALVGNPDSFHKIMSLIRKAR